eukprot:CAMPEP_0180243604 /NCGR_PEP_ID=MMETSP0987-20121128/33929_1 /TAXON_ID=697907 /ORGANISM="non described non described, Strain CCMP2293" /LENGTH=56 /DNA_ID=CAMNT_0022210963 /DNA_START=52 /DNA_END=219 /DNA_ORIENTATION=+
MNPEPCAPRTAPCVMLRRSALPAPHSWFQASSSWRLVLAIISGRSSSGRFLRRLDI